jgi:hypothetical protein
MASTALDLPLPVRVEEFEFRMNWSVYSELVRNVS